MPILNFQQSDAIGGLIGGNAARMEEDTTRLNQQKTLEEILKAQQEFKNNEVMNPLRQEYQRAQTDDMRSQTESRTQQTNEAKRKANYENLQNYYDEVARNASFMVPGQEDEIATRYNIPANHPIRNTVKQALKADAQNKGMYGPGETPRQSEMEKLQEKLILMNPDNQKQMLKDKAAAEKQNSINQTNLLREQMRQDAYQRRTEMMQKAAEVRQKAQELAAAKKIPSANQVLGAALEEVNRIDRLPDGPTKTEQMQKAKDNLDRITFALGNIASARTWAQAQTEAKKLEALGVHLQLSPEGFQAPSGANPPPRKEPGASPAAENGLKTTAKGTKYIMNQDTPAAPAAQQSAPAPGDYTQNTDWYLRPGAQSGVSAIPGA